MISNIENFIVSEIKGRAGIITLNRPKNLNALHLPMIQQVYQTLVSWKNNLAVERVVFDSNSDKAFCAGGDVRAIYDAIKVQDYHLAFQFFYDEYQLNHLIFSFPKPIISLIDGIIMGGGAGLAMNGTYRVVTERTIFAMPETAIGFFPDVGAGYFLNRCPGKIGLYLALSGTKISAGDCLYSKLATHGVLKSQLDNLKDQLINDQSNLQDILKKHHVVLGQSDLASHQSAIDRYFSQPTIEKCVQALQTDVEEWPQKVLETLSKRSPTSLKVTFSYMQKMIEANFKQVMQQTLVLSQFFVKSYDFQEGVRAVLVDKDQQPKWQPDTLASINSKLVEQALHFSIRQKLPI